jgi:hypothetical protein
MTYNALLKRLQKMTPEQLRQKVKLYEGCSGNWDSLTSVEVSDVSVYLDGDPVIKRGDLFLLHDH